MTIAATQSPDIPWSLFAPGAQKTSGPVSVSGRGGGLPPAPSSSHRNGAYADVEERRAARQSGGTDLRAGDDAVAGKNDAFFGEDGFTFGDLVDIVNPLQHLPVISTLYREMTGDDISQGARLAGGSLYGGPIGLVTAIADNAVTAQTGKDLGETAMAFLLGDEAPAPSDGATVLAEAEANFATDASRAPAVPQPGTTPNIEQLASLAPAAGAGAGARSLFSGDITSSNATNPGARSVAAGGIAPTGFVTPAPQAVSKPVPAEQAHSRPQVFGTNPASNAPAPEALRAQAPTADHGGTPAPRGPTTLSPAAAQKLMELAQRSQSTASPPRRDPGIVAETPAPEPNNVAPAPPAPPAPPARTASADVPEGLSPPPMKDIPNAMLSALQKYEAMKRNPG